MPAIKVALAITEGMPIFEAAIPCAVFDRARIGLPDPWYDFKVCAAEPQRTKTGSSFVASTPHGLDELAEADTVIVPACANLLDDVPSDLVNAVRVAYDRGARIVSLCTGAFVLAAAGLLDGRRATVHWRYAQEFADRYPRVAVDPRSTWVRDGNIYTSAGISAGIDLALAWLEEDLGAAFALKVARELVLFLRRPGGQDQLSVSLEAQGAQTRSLRELQAWMMEHLAQPLSVGALADRVAMSPRNFARLFAQEVGTAPGRYLLRLRVEAARRLLEQTDGSIGQVATAVGFRSADVLRRAFLRLLGTPPVRYRQHFRTPATRAPMPSRRVPDALATIRRDIATAARVATGRDRGDPLGFRSLDEVHVSDGRKPTSRHHPIAAAPRRRQPVMRKARRTGSSVPGSGR